jgi:hypothetical protein
MSFVNVDIPVTPLLPLPGTIKFICEEIFEDPKGPTRSRNSKKDGKYNGLKKKK